MESLFDVLVQSLGDPRLGLFVADHLRDGYRLDCLQVLPVRALTLEGNVRPAGAHEHDRRMITGLGTGASEVQSQGCPLLLGEFLHLAQGGLVPLEDVCFQRVPSACRRRLGRHAEVCRCQDAASVHKLHGGYGVAQYR